MADPATLLRSRASDLLMGARQVALAMRGHHAGPPPGARRRQLVRLARERGHRAFVEAGTYFGDTTALLARHVPEVWTVEVDPTLHAGAAERFAGSRGVHVVLGDALTEIPRIVASLTVPPLVFLDGHYSGGITGRGEQDEPAPSILERLGGSEALPGTTIVVDDVRLFGTTDGFPDFSSLFESARAAYPGATVTVELDGLVIRA